MRRKTTEGSYTVTGPYENDHPVVSVGAGMSCGLTFASRHRSVDGELTYYVRDIAGSPYARITKREDGVITTELLAP